MIKIDYKKVINKISIKGKINNKFKHLQFKI